MSAVALHASIARRIRDGQAGREMDLAAAELGEQRLEDIQHERAVERRHRRRDRENAAQRARRAPVRFWLHGRHRRGRAVRYASRLPVRQSSHRYGVS